MKIAWLVVIAASAAVLGGCAAPESTPTQDSGVSATLELPSPAPSTALEPTFEMPIAPPPAPALPPAPQPPAPQPPAPRPPAPVLPPDPPAPPPAPAPAPRQAPAAASSDCDPNYTGACVPIASDVDCAGGSGNGPAYVSGPVRVVGNDVYGLDSDGDGVGCE
jgi:hypothetical protein